MTRLAIKSMSVEIIMCWKENEQIIYIDVRNCRHST